MNIADAMLAMVRADALGEFVPDVANFRRERSTGTRNHLGELVVTSTETLDLYLIETTGRGKLDDEVRNEREVGGQIQGELILMSLEDVLAEGDRVVRIATGDPWLVVAIDVPRLNGQAVSYNYRIRRQTD